MPCRLVERKHAQHWKLSTESHGVTTQNYVISTLWGTTELCQKTLLDSFHTEKETNLSGIIYIHNIQYIILISMRLQQMVQAQDHKRPPGAKVRPHLQYPHLQGTVLNQAQVHIHLDLPITVLT
jgi:hypothetical protein